MKRTHRIGIALCACLLASLSPVGADACSEVFLKRDAVLVSARNFDFSRAKGAVRFSPAGMRRKAQYAPTGRRPLEWTSEYASVAFDTILQRTTSPEDGIVYAGVDGLNRAGLKVGTYYLETSVFPQTGPETTIDICSLQQHLLDTCGGVDAALADLASGRYRVTSTPVEGLEIKLHLYLHDATGASAIVEFVGGAMKVTRDPKIPVLTNTEYDESVASLARYAEFGGSLPVPGGRESIDRFVRGASYRSHMPVPDDPARAVAFGFAAAQVLSVPPESPDGNTFWTIVTDVAGRRIFFRTLDNPAVARISLDELAKSAKVSSEIDLLRTDLSGDIGALFDRTNAFNPAAIPPAPDYARASDWASLPPEADRTKSTDVFFVHPTAFFFPNAWNECLESNRQNPLVDADLAKTAGVFALTCNIFAPRYREANIKVLSASEQDKSRALGIAYSDVEKAFDYYMEHFNAGRPFILAGHSQGSNLLLWLLQRRFGNPKLRERLVASYIIGWSVTPDDLEKYPQLVMSDSPTRTGCIISYNTQAVSPDITIAIPGAVGVNPLTMDTTGEATPKERNLGAVFFIDGKRIEVSQFTGAQTVDGALIVPRPARTDLVRGAASGFYHPYDYSFFFRNLERNVAERVAAFLKEHPETK
jgi:penicillin V acylase-like amidase (Ntn superfamily)